MTGSPRQQRNRPSVTMPAGLTLGRVRGVPIIVAPSWLLIGLLLTTVYAPILRDAVDGLGSGAAYAAALGFTIVFAGCVLAHEVGHTLVSTALRYPVRRVVLFALGGVSEVSEEPSRARDELLIAGAGPLVSVLISVGAWFGYHATPDGALVTALLALLWWSNLVLAAFNLLPGLPLDGGRLLRALVVGYGASTLAGTRVAAWAGRAVAVAVALTGLYLNRGTGSIVAGIFSVALAWYLWFGAGQSLRVAEVAARLPAVDVRALLRPGMFVAPDVSVAEALRRAWDNHARGLVVVDAGSAPSAIVDEAMIANVTAEQREWTPVSSVARPIEDGLVLPVDIDAQALLRRMQDTPAIEYLMVHPDGSPAGLINARDFAARLQGRQ